MRAVRGGPSTGSRHVPRLIWVVVLGAFISGCGFGLTLAPQLRCSPSFPCSHLDTGACPS